MNTCSVEGCGRKATYRGYCSTHYKQFLKFGKIVEKEIAVRDKTRVCCVEGCNEPYHANGYCRRHYTQFRKHGKIISVDRILSPRIGERKKGGYVYLLRPDHPMSDVRGYVKRSWLVWEKNTGHIVTPPEVVHHKNGIRNDDRFENLSLLKNKSEHCKEHGGRIGGIRIVTKEMAIDEMKSVYERIGDPFTIRRFVAHASISKTAIQKFGWNALKEEICVP